MFDVKKFIYFSEFLTFSGSQETVGALDTNMRTVEIESKI
jgi:hypothetical protein